MTGYEHNIPLISLPDPNDRHVVAAAMHAGAQAIVTFNVQDFPADELQRLGLEALHPDDFLVSRIAVDAAAVAAVIRREAAALAHPPMSPAEILDRLDVVLSQGREHSLAVAQLRPLLPP